MLTNKHSTGPHSLFVLAWTITAHQDEELLGRQADALLDFVALLGCHDMVPQLLRVLAVVDLIQQPLLTPALTTGSRTPPPC